jgi:Ca-activated chloride channel family protein
MAGELRFTATPHRLAYQTLPTAQQAYVLLEAMPTEFAPGTGSQPVNFCLVLDRSGSMAGEKLKCMKEAAILVVEHLGPKDLLSIVIFDDVNPADLIVPSGMVQDREVVKRRIEAIEERGGTHMSTGMRLGLEELQKGQSADRVSSMLLLTDGQTWEDQQTCRDLADQCRTAGMPIYVLGLGVGAESNWDPLLLEDLAQKSGGDWTAIETPQQAGAIFEKTLQGMQGTAVTNAFLTMRLVKGVTPRTVWRVTPLISRLDQQFPGSAQGAESNQGDEGAQRPGSAQAVSLHDVQVFLGDIQHGAGQSILAEVLLPPRPAGLYRFIQADITYDVPGSGITDQKVSVDLTLPFTDDAVQASQTEARLMNIIERVVAHKLQTQALDEAAAGNAAKATQKLRAAATRLLELGEVELAQQANQQAQQIEQDGQIDPAAAQKMRYATKRLTESETE